MAVLAHVCPHCSTRIAHEVRGGTITRIGYPALLLHCGACHMPTVAIVIPNGGTHDVMGRISASGIVLNDYIVSVALQFPNDLEEKAPDHIPTEVARVYLQSRAAHRRNEMDIAAMGYRRTVELALKAADPSIKGQLGPRTDALTARKVLTGPMKEWAEQVRLLGNEANHDPPEPDAPALEDLHLFTETLLEQLFTMPERLRQRRALSAAAKAPPPLIDGS